MGVDLARTAPLPANRDGTRSGVKGGRRPSHSDRQTLEAGQAGPGTLSSAELKDH